MELVSQSLPHSSSVSQVHMLRGEEEVNWIRMFKVSRWQERWATCRKGLGKSDTGHGMKDGENIQEIMSGENRPKGRESCPIHCL